MATQRISPQDWYSGNVEVHDGDELILDHGTWSQPIILNGLKNVTISCEEGVVIDGMMRADDFRSDANAWARQEHDEGRYPGQHRRINVAIIQIRNCHNARLDKLIIRGSWPTAIYIENSKDTELSRLTINEGTFAIGVRGGAGLTLRGCRWTQDKRIWKEIAWNRIHDLHETEPAVRDDDWRAFDGSLINAEGLSGVLWVEGCRVVDTFNGVHVWDDLGGKLAALVVRHCHFERVRDNAVECERRAVGVWVGQNVFADVHSTISLDSVKLAGWIYLFGNSGWFTSIQGPPDDEHNGGGFLKLPNKKPEEFSAKGFTYILHNSLVQRASYAKRGFWKKLRVFSNAINYPTAEEWPGEEIDKFLERPFFGEVTGAPTKERFTTNWPALDIQFSGDFIRHLEVPDVLREAGYAPQAGFKPIAKDPKFVGPILPASNSESLELQEDSPCRQSAPEMEVLVPEGVGPQASATVEAVILAAGRSAGSWQSGMLFDEPRLLPATLRSRWLEPPEVAMGLPLIG